MASIHKSESGAQLLARLSAKAELNTLDPELCPWGYEIGNIVELIGEEGTGKTQYLMHIIAICILPPEWKNISLGGLGISVLFIDTDFHISVIRLTGMLESRIAAAIEDGEANRTGMSCSEEEVEAFIITCLERLYLVRCGSSFQLLLTLHSLDSIMCSKQEISVLMIDSLTAFYWMDKLSGGDSVLSQEINMKKCVAVIKTLVDAHNLLLFATHAAIFNKRSKTDNQPGAESKYGESSPYLVELPEGKSNSRHAEYSQYITKDWQRLVTNKIILHKEKKDTKVVYYVSHECNKFKPIQHVQRTFTIDGHGIKFSNK